MDDVGGTGRCVRGVADGFDWTNGARAGRREKRVIAENCGDGDLSANASGKSKRPMPRRVHRTTAPLSLGEPFDSRWSVAPRVHRKRSNFYDDSDKNYERLFAYLRADILNNFTDFVLIV